MALWERVEARYEGNESDLDEHVHELMAKEAAAINNAGLLDQFNCLCDGAGLGWIETVLLRDDGVKG